MDTKTTIGELFSQKIQFSVPSYQRAYSWGVESKDSKMNQVGQFLVDIMEQNPEKKYFFGHFLFEKEKASENNHYYVVDGQQRLTTIIIFMSCLLSECKERNLSQISNMILDEIKEFYLIHRIQKFYTVKADAHYFYERIISCNKDTIRQTKRKSEKCIYDAVNFFSKKMKLANDEDIQKWFNIIHTAQITTFVVDGEDAKLMATQIFSFQNDRGKELTTLEKLKAFFMHRVYKLEIVDPLSKIEKLEEMFADIYTQTEDLHAGEDAILNWHCQAFTTGWGAAFDNIKDDLKKSTTPAQWIVDFTASLMKTFRVMRDIEQSEVNPCNGTDLIASICFLDKANAMPTMIKLAHYDKINHNNSEALCCIEQILFKLTFTTGDHRTNNLIKFAKEYKSDKYDELLKKLLYCVKRGFKDYWDFNGSCVRYFTDNNWHYDSRIKYILYKYENHLREINRQPFLSIDECTNIFRDKKSVENTLDHITPQNPDFMQYDDDFKSKYLNNIGNLSLLTWGNNSSKSNCNPAREDIREKYNSCFYAQKEIYSTLCTKGKWTTTEIEERKKKLIDFVIKHWNLSQAH